ncbi:MAG TPA: hypothetical protein VIY86_00570, partial [Pirellulaceae bacterium]
ESPHSKVNNLECGNSLPLCQLVGIANTVVSTHIPNPLIIEIAAERRRAGLNRVGNADARLAV